MSEFELAQIRSTTLVMIHGAVLISLLTKIAVTGLRAIPFAYHP
jgi:hypothetical protein